MSTLMIRQNVTRIAQGNVQLVLVAMLDKIDALEEALDALSVAPVVAHGPDPMATARLEAAIKNDNEEFEKCDKELKSDAEELAEEKPKPEEKLEEGK